MTPSVEFLPHMLSRGTDLSERIPESWASIPSSSESTADLLQSKLLTSPAHPCTFRHSSDVIPFQVSALFLHWYDAASRCGPEVPRTLW